MKPYLCLFILAVFCTLSKTRAQSTYPVNGPQDVVTQYIALKNASVYTDATTKIEQATILIKDGVIEALGANIPIPKEARVYLLNGRTIYPSFIDLYSNYGIKEHQLKREDRTGFLSAKNGAYGWNEAIRAEINAADLFVHDEKKAALYRAAGFSILLTGSHDGICRGTSALVNLNDQKENKSIVAPMVAAGFSFRKGSSTQEYPSSLMGSIALLRQTYYDAKWYKTQQAEKDLTLESFHKLITLPGIFDAGEKLSILRADKIADEFGARYIIKGNGQEYQRIQEIKEANVSLIIPVNFPKPYTITDPWDAEYIATTDLKHWEMAPSNPGALAAAKIPFALTSYGCENAETFISNIRKAVKYGLAEADALAALTSVPAKFIGNEQITGKIEKGKPAHFIICSGNFFDERTVILENWVAGKQFVINTSNNLSVAGTYKVIHPQLGTYIAHIAAGKQHSFFASDKDTLHATFQNENNLVQLTVEHPEDSNDVITISGWIAVTDSSTYPYRLKHMKGYAFFKGIQQSFEMILQQADEDDEKDSMIIAPKISTITYPFNDFGWETKPKQETVLFKNATVWTNEQEGITEMDVLVENGKIKATGKNLDAKNVRVIDAKGKHLTSGIIDEHSHIAITQGVNEGTQAVTSEVRIGDVVNSEDINIYRQLAGGVVLSQLLHGSANPIGGQSAIIKLRWGLSPEKMKVDGADGFIKFALGENVKQSNWGDHNTWRYPQSRMGVEQVFTDAFTRAREYEARLKTDKNTRKDLELDALVEILQKKRFITCHSYVQSEINMLMHVADTFGFRVNTFTHILEGYKLAKQMKNHQVNASTFADWWAYKYEVIEAIPYNAAILIKAGVNTGINSDDAEMGRRLNQEAAKTIKYGKLTEEEAWKLVTLNPAKMLHLDSRTGSIKAGKDADLVLWNTNPLSIYARAEMTFVDGVCYYSLEEDEQRRIRTRNERSRIIQLMIKAKKEGESTQPAVLHEEESYHCND